MKIAIMMRAMDQDSGHQAITMGLVENMILHDKAHEFILLYRTTKFLGRFAQYSNVKEILVNAPHKLLWDQIAVSYHAWKEKADVIYNPKFSVPIITSCPVVMGLHEPAWWAWPEHYEWLDRNYMKLMLPIYIRKSKHLFPISQFVVDECKKYINLPFDNVTVAYPAPKEYFKKVSDPKILEDIKKKYALPDKFVFSTTRVDHPGLENSDSFFEGKNPETTVKAFIKCKKENELPHKLVLAGRRVKEYMLHLGLTNEDLKDVIFLDYVTHTELPALLSLTDLFVIPSYYESYAMALVEAMCCGCAIVASETGACPEITAGSALLADPYNADDFAEKMKSVLIDAEIQKKLELEADRRAAFFSWERTAGRVIEDIIKVVERN